MLSVGGGHPAQNKGTTQWLIRMLDFGPDGQSMESGPYDDLERASEDAVDYSRTWDSVQVYVRTIGPWEKA